jgi:hypothetical protein
VIEKKYHSPQKIILDYVSSLIKPGAKVLEIGPGFEPFERGYTFLWLDR